MQIALAFLILLVFILVFWKSFSWLGDQVFDGLDRRLSGQLSLSMYRWYWRKSSDFITGCVGAACLLALAVMFRALSLVFYDCSPGGYAMTIIALGGVLFLIFDAAQYIQFFRNHREEAARRLIDNNFWCED